MVTKGQPGGEGGGGGRAIDDRADTVPGEAGTAESMTRAWPGRGRSVV